MDPKIKKLKSTTFFGKRLTRRRIADVQEAVAGSPELSRRKLGHRVCELLGWVTPKGNNRIQACLRLLEHLEEHGILSLPPVNASKRRGPQKPVVRTERGEPQPSIEEDLSDLEPLALRVVTEEVDEWNELVDRYHYLGFKQPRGPRLRYFIVDRQGRKLGCLLFSGASKALACRDDWVGWQEASRKKHLHLVVQNGRFLILPWVKVNNLASRVLATACRQLADDWKKRHGYKPVLIETYVDTSKFDAICYRAANWRYLGQTKPRMAGKQTKPRKGVFVYPLVGNCQAILRDGPRAARKSRKSRRLRTEPQPVPTFSPDDPFVQLWKNIVAAVVDVANEHDRAWQKRTRILNTLLVVLFVFRLVFSKGRQGYGTTLVDLWGQCRTLGITLPQPAPVSPAAMSNARAKVNESVFKDIHDEILRQVDRGDDRLWKGHRIFAVDGSKINLPRALTKDGYRIPSDNAWYPQGLLSCLYRLRSKIPVDFDLFSHDDERKAALTHLEALSGNDVVVYDRGYYAWEMLHRHVTRGIHPVFRIKEKANNVFDAFIASDETDAVVAISPTAEVRKKLRIQKIDHSIRLVKYAINGTSYILGTTLFDKDRYPVEDLSDLYHGRWSIEELYKISKQLMAIEEFHGRQERGVKQELFAHFVLITLTRLFSNRSEDWIDHHRSDRGKPAMQTNFKNGLTTVARNIEALLLRQANMIRQTITEIVNDLTTCRQRLRPNRSYDRRSRKPIGKWRAPKAAKAAG